MVNPLSVNINTPVAANHDKILGDLRSKVSDRDRATTKKAAEDFESLFLNIVLKSMRDTVQKSGLIDGGNAEDIYRSMLDDEYSKIMAAQRHTGLADNIEEFLLNSQAQIRAAEPAKIQALQAYQKSAAGEGIAVASKTGDNK